MKRILSFILSVLAGVLIAFFIILPLPQAIDDFQVERAVTAPNFNYSQYEGWAYAYDALQRQGTVLYSNYPDDPEEREMYYLRGYPGRWLPQYLEDFGIIAQKDYAGNFVFIEQKAQISRFLNNETVILNNALSNFKPISDPINANDANVIQAIQSYTYMINELNSAISEMTLDDAHAQPLGEFIYERIGQDTLSDPIAYGNVAINYLEVNLDKYRSDYISFIEDDANSDSVDQGRVEQVLLIIGEGNQEG